MIACLAAVANASIHGHGAIVSGPSGVVTDHGAVGPVHDVWGHGHAALVAPIVHTVAVAPVAHHGVVVSHHGLGHGIALGHGLAHHSIDGVVTHSHHGVAIEGPHTVPAVVKGPSGKIVADGLYGVPHHGHHW